MERIDRVLKAIMGLGVAGAIALAVLVIVTLVNRGDTTAQHTTAPSTHRISSGPRLTPTLPPSGLDPFRAPQVSCAQKRTSCALALLILINRDRAAHHRPPLVYDGTQSKGLAAQGGTTACTGSIGHSMAMAESNRLWHRDARFRYAGYPRDICGTVAHSAENVGAARGSEWAALQKIEAHILGAGPGSRSYRHLMSLRFTRVGLGIVRRGNKYFVTEDFLG